MSSPSPRSKSLDASSASQSATIPGPLYPETAALLEHTGARTVTVTVMVSVSPWESVAVSV